jgi:Cu(I)/Ag(I) efflux system membrane fusion protein
MWLEAAVPQTGIAGIAAGTPVEARVDAVPQEVFRGRLESLLPQVETSNRTQRARIVLDNSHGLLAPGMFARVTFKSVDGAEHPLVPTEALIGSGAQARVIVLDEGDTFHPVAVQLGRSSGGMTEVVSGLRGGERVVASGQFLIDSEANLSGALHRMDAQPDAPPHRDNNPSSHQPARGAHDLSPPPVKAKSPEHDVHGNHEQSPPAESGGAP